MDNSEKVIQKLLLTSMYNKLRKTVYYEPVIMGTIEVESLQPHLSDLITFIQNTFDFSLAELSKEVHVSESTLKNLKYNYQSGNQRIRKGSVDKILNTAHQFISIADGNHQIIETENFEFNEKILDKLQTMTKSN